ncbi:MAG TPA: hypothetical protein VFI22_00110, partial [Thermomicrobiales bacterium]|nr:hypothetical protein [Thermomicrobiales bacterium]
MSRLRVLTTIAIAPLGRQEIARLALDALGMRLEPASIAMLFERSGGNPFFAEELLRHWQESDAVAFGPGGARVTASPGDVPLTIRATVMQRLSRLDPAAADLLRTAAVVGRFVDLAPLAAAPGIEPEAAESSLMEGVRAHLLRATVDGGFLFGHDSIREALAADVAPIRRRRLHGFMAHAIETIEGAGADRRAAEIAFHYVWSGDRERARAWSERAAAQSMRSAAFSETAAHLRNALAAAREDDPDRGSLLLALGDAETLADDDSAAPTLTAAVDWFRARGETVRAASALRLLGQAHARRERHADARIAF